MSECEHFNIQVDFSIEEEPWVCLDCGYSSIPGLVGYMRE